MPKLVKTEISALLQLCSMWSSRGSEMSKQLRYSLETEGRQVFILDLLLIHFEQVIPPFSGYLNDRFPSDWLRLSQHKGSEYTSQDTEAPKGT